MTIQQGGGVNGSQTWKPGGGSKEQADSQGVRQKCTSGNKVRVWKSSSLRDPGRNMVWPPGRSWDLSRVLMYQFRHRTQEPFNRAAHAMRRWGQGRERSVSLGCRILDSCTLTQGSWPQRKPRWRCVCQELQGCASWQVHRLTVQSLQKLIKKRDHYPTCAYFPEDRTNWDGVWRSPISGKALHFISLVANVELLVFFEFITMLTKC